MTLTEGNNIIAEFMNVVETPCFILNNGKRNPYMRMTIPGLDEEVKYFALRTHEFNDYTCLKFHDSWDWLLPVVKKCYVMDSQLFGLCGLLDFLLDSEDKTRVWTSVIKFIKITNAKNQRSNPG